MTGHGGNDTYFVDNASDEVTESGGRRRRPGADQRELDSHDRRRRRDAAHHQRRRLGAINLTGNETGNVVRGNNGQQRHSTAATAMTS